MASVDIEGLQWLEMCSDRSLPCLVGTHLGHAEARTKDKRLLFRDEVGLEDLEQYVRFACQVGGYPGNSPLNRARVSTVLIAALHRLL